MTTISFQDDLIDGASEDNSDHLNNGTYYVYDPANRYDFGSSTDLTIPKFQRLNRFNDLERRAVDLCMFINTACQPIKVIPVISVVNYNPLPLKGH
jgi:hypothetical protein